MKAVVSVLFFSNKLSLIFLIFCCVCTISELRVSLAAAADAVAPLKAQLDAEVAQRRALDHVAHAERWQAEQQVPSTGNAQNALLHIIRLVYVFTTCFCLLSSCFSHNQPHCCFLSLPPSTPDTRKR